MSWQRARQPDQKAERVATILDAAATLFDAREFSEIAMRDVAEQAGLGKASLYHYFKTKEEVFISLYYEELLQWVDEIAGRLARLRAPHADRIAKALADSLRERTRFCRLTVIFSAVLERNLSVEFLRDFKSSLLPPMGRVATALQQIAPQINDSAAHELLFQHHAFVAGLWPLANPSPEVSAVLKEEQFRKLEIDFYRVFQSTMQQLLQAKLTPDA